MVLCLTSASTIAQNSVNRNPYKNQMQLTLTTGDIKYYNTDDVRQVDIQGTNVSVNPATGTVDSYSGTISRIAFAKKADEGTQGKYENSDGKIRFTESKGWLETVYAKWEHYEGAESYNVYCNGKLIDKQLVRRYATYIRADVVGLPATSTYTLRVVPVSADGTEIEAAANTVADLQVRNYSREGFAHMKSGTKGVGAYNNDGSLKTGAKVFYVSANTAKTISTTVSVGNGKTQTCTGIQAIIDAYQKGYDTTPIAFRFIGLVKKENLDAVSSSSEGLQIKGKSSYSEMNITIEGIGEDATVHGFGFLLRNASGVEIRNLAIMRCMDDCVSIDTENSMIWVHNMDFFYGPNGGGDHAKGDGIVDLKDDSQYLTISYNRFWDTGKSSLCGMTGETKPNYITYQHNWFDHADSRCPRVRTMSVHVWNNYFDGVAKYGVGATTGSSVFVEANYFRGTSKPMLISQQGSDIASDPKGTFSGENGGIIKSYGNVFAEKPSTFKYVTWQQNNTQFDAYEAISRTEKVPSTVVALKGASVYDNFDTDSTLMYSYTADAAEYVPAVVTGFYGAGRLNHGDFYYDLSGTDSKYAYDSTLGSLLDNYSSSLLSIYGEGSSSGEGGGDTGGGDTGGGDTGGGSTEDPSGTVLCTFEGKTPSASWISVTGNYSTSKGSATIDGTTYTTCVKMESSTSITFTLSEARKVTLYFADSETASAKIDGTKLSGATGSTYTTSMAVGTHTITKDKSVNLFGIKFVPEQ